MKQLLHSILDLRLMIIETTKGSTPISLSDRLPTDQDCSIVECSSWKMRRCWLGKPLFHAGNMLWIWEWAIAPETLKMAPWPHTHWLPADTQTLPARVKTPVSYLHRIKHVD